VTGKRPLAPVAVFHQGALDKNLPGDHRVDMAEGHRLAIENRQAKKGLLLIGHHLAAPRIVIGFEMAFAHQMTGQGGQPVRVDTRRLVGVEPRGFDHLRRHHPFGRLFEQPGTGKDMELAIAGAEKFPLVLAKANMAQQAAEQ